MFLLRRGSGRLTPEQVHARSSAGTAALLDVRETPERRAGHRSQQAAELPAARGVDAVDVTGGMNTRAGAGRPVAEERGQGGRTA
ncbi:rhodanese-like domain-containing protein [Streptomyces sp. NPDC085927]|uniref:rhodanese-like domain-containing protein n=1 Tax=Streptomyces sp. NPDC085927 TaxID=3365738 RepID=UPI0037CD8969